MQQELLRPQAGVSKASSSHPGDQEIRPSNGSGGSFESWIKLTWKLFQVCQLHESTISLLPIRARASCLLTKES